MNTNRFRQIFWRGLTLAGLLLGGCQPTDDASSSQESLAVFSIPDGHWSSELYGADWSAFPTASFLSDKILQDFSYAGYARGERPIPTSGSLPRFNAVELFGADPNGIQDSTAAIQKALDAAGRAGGGEVFLPEGTYRIEVPASRSCALHVKFSNVVLRGAGPELTKILNSTTEMRGKQIILVEPWPKSNWAEEENPRTTISADLPGPTIEIPVEDTTGFEVGDWVVLRNNPTEAWVLERGEPDWVGHEKKLGAILWLRRIQAVDPEKKLLTIDVPTRYALGTRNAPHIYRKTGLLHEVGLEDFSIGNIEHPGKNGWGTLDFAAPSGEYTRRLAEGYGLPEDFAEQKKSAFDVHFSFAIVFSGVVDGWIRNIRSFCHDENSTGTHILSNGIRLVQCRGVTVEDCRMEHAQYGGGGGNGYLFRLDDSNECLLKNCEAEFSRHGFSISGMASSGNVLLHCSDKDTGRQTGGSGDEKTAGKGSDHHMWFSHSNLLDNCRAENSWFEARDRFYEKMSAPKHNQTAAHTVFWNTQGISNSFHEFVVWSNQGNYGYVIGTRGPEHRVRLDGDYPHRNLDPVDHVEGIGLGDTLHPASLYEHQLQRRLAQ